MSVIDFTDEEFREATLGKKSERIDTKSILEHVDNMEHDPIFVPPPVMSSADKISTTCDELKRFLLVKNERYGDSALNPIKVFSKGDASDKIDIRMDDKLSRIIESDKQRMNDFVDLTGYLVLKCIDKGWTDFSELLD